MEGGNDDEAKPQKVGRSTQDVLGSIVCHVRCFMSFDASMKQPSNYDKTTALRFLLPIHKTIQ